MNCCVYGIMFLFVVSFIIVVITANLDEEKFENAIEQINNFIDCCKMFLKRK